MLGINDYDPGQKVKIVDHTNKKVTNLIGTVSERKKYVVLVDTDAGIVYCQAHQIERIK